MNGVIPIIVLLVVFGLVVGIYFWIISKPPVGQGAIDLRVTDKLEGEVSSIVITASDIRVSTSSTVIDGTDHDWVELVKGPKTFDLVKVQGLEESLGITNLSYGKYNQIRLTIDQCVVMMDGQEYLANVPSGALKMIKPFTVEEGKTTVVTIDFDAGESLTMSGDRLQLRPVVKLLVRDSSQPFDKAQTFGGVAGV